MHDFHEHYHDHEHHHQAALGLQEAKHTMPLLALAGNPNAGKTTAFNAYTGARQHVGNYPGITVEKKEGIAHIDGEDVCLIDLPGAYSLSAYTQEERVAREVIVHERPLAVMAVLNASALERNLYLVVQLLEMGVPVAVGLNMMDEAREQGISIDVQRLAERLHIPVIATVARNGEGLDEFLRQALAFGRKRQTEAWTALELSYGPDLDPIVQHLTKIIEQYRINPKTPARWVAIKLLEQDQKMLRNISEMHPELAALALSELEKVDAHVRQTLDTTPEAIIADYRYGFIASLLRDGVLVRQPLMTERLARSDRADKVLTQQFLGPLIMLCILYIMYRITFTLGAYPMEWVSMGFDLLRHGVDSWLADGPLKSLLVAGLIDGVGGVMSFVPLILLIFLQIAVLEDSGYMARMAYMLDRVFRIFGLHGCSVVPFILGGGVAGGCAVPGIMAARTLRSPREKLATLLTVPFMSCGAKLPVFILFAGAFFPHEEASVIFLLTLTGWLVALLTARLLRSTVIRGPATPFVMELPPYRFPTIQGLCIHSVERTWEFLKKAGTLILAISILLWAAMTYPGLPAEDLERFAQERAAVHSQLAINTESAGREVQEQLQSSGMRLPLGELENPSLAAARAQLLAIDMAQSDAALRYSAAGRIGAFMEPATRYAGFGWEANIALLGGFAAKEVIVTTLGTAYSLSHFGDAQPLAVQIAESPDWSRASAVSFLLFVLLYAPCFVSLVAIRQETGSTGWALFSLLFNTAVAYTVAVCAYTLLS